MTLRIPDWLLGRTGEPLSRRQTVRIACDRARCNLGEIVDLSATGARIACRRFFRPVEGKPVELTLETPGGEVRVPSIVCWTRLDENGWEAGLAFHGLSERDAAVIGGFIKAHRFGDEARSA
jgi:hypothetical protein